MQKTHFNEIFMKMTRICLLGPILTRFKPRLPKWLKSAFRANSGQIWAQAAKLVKIGLLGPILSRSVSRLLKWLKLAFWDQFWPDLGPGRQSGENEPSGVNSNQIGARAFGSISHDPFIFFDLFLVGSTPLHDD